MERNIVLGILAGLFLLTTSFNPAAIIVPYKLKTVVIDAGHGGKDPGTLGASSKEKDVALAIALELGELISKYLPEVKVVYTRKDDTFIELAERAQIANKAEADLFISIHCNAAQNHEVSGTETYIMGLHVNEQNLNVAKRENSVILLEDNYEQQYEGFDPSSPESYIMFSLMQNAYLQNSLTLAENIEHQFAKRVGRSSRGVKQAGFVVLWRTTMPSVLVETGFISNDKEEQFLNDKLGRTYMASGLFRAFRDYKAELEANN